MAKIKNMMETANQKLREGLAEAGLTEHEGFLLDQVFKEDARQQKAKERAVFVQGLVLGMVLITSFVILATYV